MDNIIINNEQLSDFYLNLRGYGNNNQVTHPKVIYFKNKWNGYKFWCSYTPYPYADQSKENPFIMVSNDLVNWKKKKNAKNPIDSPISKDYKKIYNSDTHLVYNSDLDRLECYWRYVNDKTHKVVIYRRTTTDGIKWTKKEKILENDRRTIDYLSPAIIYKNNKYQWWFVDRNKTIKYMEYDTLKNKWSKIVNLDIKYYSKNLQSWHLDVIETVNGYEMIIVAFKEWRLRTKMNLYYCKSKDNINWSRAKIILQPHKNSGLYRSSILYINNMYYILYSYIVKGKRRGVGLTYGSDINNLNGLKEKNKIEFIKNNKRMIT